MTVDLDDLVGDRQRRRRLFLLLLLLLLVVVGAGIGGFVPGFGPDDGPTLEVEGTPTPAPPGATPTATPTPTSEAPVGTPTASPSPPGTPTSTPASPTASPTPTPPGSPTASPTATPGGTEPSPTTTTEPTPTGTPPATGTPPPTTTPPGGGDDPLELSFDGDSVILDYEGVAPGEGGTETVLVSNGGTASGNLSVANIAVTDEENGIVDAEALVDDTPGQGELSQHLRLAIAITYPNGTTLSLYGTGDGPRPLDELATEGRSSSGTLPADSQATVTVTWVLPEATGNEVQSDAVAVDVTFELLAPES